MNVLGAFLARHTPAADEIETWGEMRLRVRTYLTGDLPPPDWITSVRAIVRRAAEILVVRDPGRWHILPGGRREPGETIEQTLRREILEETGWEIGAPRLLGCKHFHHLTPRPANYPYPYPDFVNLVFVADALRFSATGREVGGYELGSAFMLLDEAQHLPLTAGEQALLGQLP